MSDVQFHQTVDGPRIAYRHHESGQSDKTIVFLPGYLSDMEGSKATALIEWADTQLCGCLLLDYSGCGQSDGDFADGSLSDWRDEVLSLIEARGIDRVVLVGSSMGGWLMLLVAVALGERLHSMVGIAAAPDFSDWGFTDEQKNLLEKGETIFEDNPYGPEPTPTHAKFWQDAETHRLLSGEIPIICPARLLHGQKDEDVPHQISMRLAKQLRSDDVHVTLIKDGDHRLSRESDIKLLLGQVSNLLG